MPPEQHRGHDRGSKVPIAVHARQHPTAVALCGTEPGWGKSTTSRSKVTCPSCLREIELRLAEKKPRR
jgi:hypothetical protein